MGRAFDLNSLTRLVPQLGNCLELNTKKQKEPFSGAYLDRTDQTEDWRYNQAGILIPIKESIKLGLEVYKQGLVTKISIQPSFGAKRVVRLGAIPRRPLVLFNETNLNELVYDIKEGEELILGTNLEEMGLRFRVYPLKIN